MHEGHRERMKEKLASDSMLEDHELLEILLFFAIPRKNTNELAHSIIDACGGLENVFKADVKLLVSVNGVGKRTADFLKTVGAIYERIRANGFKEASHTIFSFRDFSAYILERFKGRKDELLELYAIDTKNRISFIQSFTSGEKDHVELSSTDVSRFIADHKPKGIVIAHNHPGAPADPSVYDTEFTRLTQVLCSLNNVTLIDHIIVGSDRTYSYYLSGELENIRKQYDIDAMMRRTERQTLQ